MNFGNVTLLLAGLGLAIAGCGDDDDPLMQEPLPQQPQLLPTAAVLDFPVTSMLVTGTRTVGLSNGGQQDLVITGIEIQGPDAGLFQLQSASPSNGSDEPTPLTIPTRQSGQLTVAFAPNG
ncbi:MAG: hypothetical protein AAF658_18955, partial [Myxococcota bacterium]